jgi:hypothetical protein
VSPRADRNASLIQKGIRAERDRCVGELQERATAEELAAAALDPGSARCGWHLGRASALRDACREILAGGWCES